MNMDIKTTIAAGCTAFLIAGASSAFAGPGEGHQHRGPSKADIIKKFDADGDGQLNETERAEARKARAAHFGKAGEGKGPHGKRGKCKKKEGGSGENGPT